MLIDDETVHKVWAIIQEDQFTRMGRQPQAGEIVRLSSGGYRVVIRYRLESGVEMRAKVQGDTLEEISEQVPALESYKILLNLEEQ